MGFEFYNMGNFNSDSDSKDSKECAMNAAKALREQVDAYTEVGFSRAEAIHITLTLILGAINSRGNDNDRE